MIYSVVVVVVVVEVGRIMRSPLMRTGWDAVKLLRPRHVVGNLPMLAATVVTAGVLIQLPILSWGWWSAIGGEGNVLLGSVDDSYATSLTQGIGVVLLVLLIVAVPALAMNEELAFRRGSERRTRVQRLANAVMFGLVHAVMGIPIGAALALSLGGLWFTSRYLHGYRRACRDGHEPVSAGVRESTAHHIAWNWTVMSIFVLALVW